MNVRRALTTPRSGMPIIALIVTIGRKKFVETSNANSVPKGLTRRGNVKFRMDYEDRKRIEAMLDENFLPREIAIMIGRSESAVQSEIKRHGGKRLYKAANAQKLSDKARIEGNKGKNSPLMHLKNRVDELEVLVKQLLEERHNEKN